MPQRIRFSLQNSILFVAIAIAAVGCIDTAQQEAEPTLYERLGGLPAIEAVVADFFQNVAADTVINHFFADSDLVQTQALVVQQICEFAEGPCTYTGHAMVPLHAGMGVRNVHFDAFVNDLVKSMNKFNVGVREQNEILTILGSLRDDIVEE